MYSKANDFDSKTFETIVLEIVQFRTLMNFKILVLNH